MAKQIETGAQVYIYNTDGFQEHSKKAVAGVLYRVTHNDGRKSNIVPVDGRSQAPNLIVLNHRLKVAGGSTTPHVEPVKAHPVSLSVAHEDAAPPSHSFAEGDTVQVLALHDVAEKFRAALTGVLLKCTGRASNGGLKLQHPSNRYGVNGAGQYIVHPSRCVRIEKPAECLPVQHMEYNGIRVGDRVKITDHEFMRSHNREAFPLAGTFKVTEIRSIHTVAGRLPRMFFRCAHTNTLILADRFKKAPVYAPANGPVPVDVYAYDVLPTVHDGVLHEVLEYRLPTGSQAARAYSHHRRAENGIWMYATSVNMVHCAIMNDGIQDNGTQWFFFPNDNEWLREQNWLVNGHGSFVPALTWPSMSNDLEAAFHVKIKTGASPDIRDYGRRLYD